MAATWQQGDTDDGLYFDPENCVSVFIDEVEPPAPAKFQYYSEAVDCWLPFNAREIVAELEEGNEIKYKVGD